MQTISVLALVLVILHLFVALVTLPDSSTADSNEEHLDNQSHLPVINRQSYFGGLADLVDHTPIRIGTMVNDKLITQSAWGIQADVVIDEFNSITPLYGFFGTIHPCPPQALVDSSLTATYNQRIRDVAKEYWICAPYLNYTNPSTVDWNTYNESVQWKWENYDNAVLWARQNDMGVHFQTFFWDFKGATILPTWVDIDNLQVSTINDTERKALARSFLLVMENHITEVVKHYCANPNNSDLNGVVYAFDVVNEVTEGDGSIRTWNSATPSNWGLINEIQSEIDPNYIGDANAYYVYKAFELSRQAVTTFCPEPRPKLIYNDKFPVDRLWNGDPDPEINPNLWANGAFDFLNAFEVNYPNLIDGLGIQAHLNIRPTALVPPDPIADLRLILEAFESTGVEVQITELDVSIRKPNYYDYFPPTEVATYFDEQAEIYKRVIHACFYEDEAYDNYNPICTGIATWDVFDRISWKQCYHPLLFNEGTPHTPPVPCDTSGLETSKLPWDNEIIGTDPPTELVRKLSYYKVYDELRTIPRNNETEIVPLPSGYPAPSSSPTAVAYP